VYPLGLEAAGKERLDSGLVLDDQDAHRSPTGIYTVGDPGEELRSPPGTALAPVKVRNLPTRVLPKAGG